MLYGNGCFKVNVMWLLTCVCVVNHSLSSLVVYVLIFYPSCLVIECISVQVGLVKVFLGLLQLGGKAMAGEAERTKEGRESVCVCGGGKSECRVVVMTLSKLFLPRTSSCRFLALPLVTARSSMNCCTLMKFFCHSLNSCSTRSSWRPWRDYGRVCECVSV